MVAIENSEGLAVEVDDLRKEVLALRRCLSDVLIMMFSLYQGEKLPDETLVRLNMMFNNYSQLLLLTEDTQQEGLRRVLGPLL